MKLKKIKNRKMNLIVIRTTKTGILGNSAPCYHCTKFLSENNSIKIDKLYYSNSDGEIECIKFTDWVKIGQTHISEGWKYIQENNYCKSCNLM